MTPTGGSSLKQHLARGHVVIERIRPQIDCGVHRAKAIVGDEVEVTADIFRDGPSLVQAVIRYRGPSDKRWLEAPMRVVENDRWAGTFKPDEVGRYRYAIQAWPDDFGSWRRDLAARAEAGQDLDTEMEEGARLIEARLRSVAARQRDVLVAAIAAMRAAARGGGDDPRVAAALDEEVATIMSRHPDRAGSTTSKPVLEVTVDRERARFGAWYEFFPRSTGKPGVHGTFKTAAKHLTTVADMGFDVVYLPPIHPIGTKFRKGKNNTLEALADDVGSPWAIGSDEGGHCDVNPKLGTIADFDYFMKAADRAGIEV